MGFAFGGVSQAPKADVPAAVVPAAEDVMAAAEVAAESHEELVEEPVAEVASTARGRGKRRRARHPAGSEKGGEFVADDPATPEVNEAFEQ